MNDETFRKEIAVKLLQGLLSNPEIDLSKIEAVVNVALQYTKELIRQYEKD